MQRIPMPRPAPTLQGELVTLREIDPVNDAADYYNWNINPEMHTWTGNEPLASVQAAADELRRMKELPDFTMWSIVDNASGKMIGRFFICLHRKDNLLIAGEGNRIACEFWRKGHNKESRKLIFAYVFNKCNADAIESECWHDNTNSRRSLLAHDFVLTHSSSEYNHKHRTMLTKDYFAITRQQWLDIK